MWKNYFPQPHRLETASRWFEKLKTQQHSEAQNKSTTTEENTALEQTYIFYQHKNTRQDATKAINKHNQVDQAGYVGLTGLAS